MATQDQTSILMDLPSVPVNHDDWIAHVAAYPEAPMRDLIEPYKAYDSKLREVFAQQPEHPAIETPNVVPIFAGHEHELKIRARNLADESKVERQRYLMPLGNRDRKPSGSPAVVQSLDEFKTNFQLFSESSLVDMDWSNVVVAGSAVVTSLLPVPEKYNSSKRALREYYHQQLAPASDVDLFLYDLTEEQAIEKIKQIEQCIKDSTLSETTTVRTKNAITIASQYPTRHVQIVLRIYRSISEILTGFDVDCSCAAYDGKQVYASPRALAAYMTQINTIDLTRRSPSYENRLSKYARRGFEVYWPLLDRSRIDPTLFERSFGRTLGLARLLVLEKLPKCTDRDAYVDQRRAERGRPAINRWATQKLRGDIKQQHDEDVAEWVQTDEISDYHTFTIPYGPKFHARKIERLLYAKDLLLNAEWNRPKDRGTTLHRHPAFFGNATDVIGDCCGYCPEPTTPEDQEIAEEEGKIYVSGTLSFIKDNPGRQAIGSFHPLTDDDWTEMAYVGNTARLCQAIVEGDLEHVQDWLGQEDADPNRRDYTGRTPLHLAVATSTPQIVQALIDAGARIVARVFDGKTALHLAAMRGEVEMVRALLVKSEANEEEEAEKEALKKKNQTQPEVPSGTNAKDSDEQMSEDDSEDEDIDMLDEDDESENADATTEGSVIKIDYKKSQDHDNLPDDTNGDEPDVYDVNVVAWDAPVSALHLAIANGRTEVVKTLIQEFGADVLLPIKLVHDYNKSPRAAILPLVLALQLSPDKAEEMTKLLIGLGASPVQGDLDHTTALHYFAAHSVDLLKTMISANRPASQQAIGHLSLSGYRYNPYANSPLKIAIERGDAACVDALLELGAKPEIDFATYIASAKSKWGLMGDDAERNQAQFRQNIEQPVLAAVRSEVPSIVLKLVDAGADINSLTPKAWSALSKNNNYHDNDTGTLLDMVRYTIRKLRTFIELGKVDGQDGWLYSGGRVDQFRYRFGAQNRFAPIPLKEEAEYLQEFEPGTYAHWVVANQIETAKKTYQRDLNGHEEWKKSQQEPEGTDEKKVAVQSLWDGFQALETELLKRNAKTFKELHPDIELGVPRPNQYNYGGNHKEDAPKPWNPLLTFRLSYLTDERRAAYLRLFQACWNADLPTIKELTLTIWGENESPLKIAVQDSQDFSPFSIAILRKHYGIARAILEIAHAQYAPEEKPMVKHSLRPRDEDEDSCDDGDVDFQIYAEIIDDRFTIENIGEVQNQVKSNVTPVQLLSWNCPVSGFPNHDDTSISAWLAPLELSNKKQYLGRSYSSGRTHGASQPTRQEIPQVERPGNLFQFAIYLDDANLLQFLIARAEEYTQHSIEADEETAPWFFRFNEADFLYAIRLGRTRALEIIIKRTGAGIPLDDLVKKSGIEIPVKPKHYQGLSVHGKKRADWANEGREVQSNAVGAQHPPLLYAASYGRLDSVEWFLSDTALRCYSEFADTHQDDIRIQNLAKTERGLRWSIAKWLDLRSHLLLHSVVIGKTNADSLTLLGNLCNTHPKALEHRSASGMTPLQLAFALHRVEMVKTLLEAGADQTARDNTGANIVHSIFNNINRQKKGPEQARQLLDLIDSRLLPSLFTERTTAMPGAATPLARWLHVASFGSVAVPYNEEVLKLILTFSKGEDLSVVNGEGDTPMHTIVRRGADALLRIMLEYRPDLLFRENASGRTPFEMAEDTYLANDVFSNPPSLSASGYSHYHSGHRRRDHGRPNISVLKRNPETFVGEPEDTRSGEEKVLQVCREFAEKTQRQKRNLVSLVEANEVAKRLALQKRSGSVGDEDDESDEEDKDEERIAGDEVNAWFQQAMFADY
ncbi:ankyrin [Decorospora gaudefroyi]|uniref:Ankyrin n=1 Tax=Decorospora gaudefroyi TaxID=184978 RepID=A0A6A5K3J6_9PLEO|nr:ankyrin [Decorospora gaudefroyi]